MWRLFVILRGVFSLFCVASFRYFVFSRGVFSLIRNFALRYFVISSFRVALFRHFVILRGVISWRKDEKTKWHKSATINYRCRFFLRGVVSSFCVKISLF